MEINYYLLAIVKAALVLFVLLTACAYLVWVERKVLAHIQLRPGPYRVGPHGLLQPLADLVKLVTKEGVIPPYVSTFYYLLAPILAVSLGLISVVVMPFTGEFELFGIRTSLGLSDINFGILFALAISSLGVYGIAIGGWASNSKYSLMGALRSSAQMISYELPMALAIVSPLLIMNTLSFQEMVQAQSGYWLGFIPKWSIFAGPVPQLLAFVIFMIAGFAETNRIPFDLPEAEAELVAGFHTEYSSLMFGAFFVAEYANIITFCLMGTALFLGGYHPLWPADYGSDFAPVALFLSVAAMLFFHATQTLRSRMWDRFSFPVFGVVFLGLAGIFLIPMLKPILIPLFWYLAKTGFLIFVFIWVRGTLPRFRYDQLMRFAWLFLFPIAVANLLVTGLVVALTSK